MNSLTSIYKRKKRLIALALSLSMFASVGCSKENKKDNLQTNQYNIESTDNMDNTNKFLYYIYPNGYYFVRDNSESGKPYEQWHAIKKSDVKKRKYDFVVESSTISNVITITNVESITYLVPKGFELRVFDGVLFGVPSSADYTYENLSRLLLIEELNDGTKSYTIPLGFKLCEIIEDNNISYNLEERLVKKIK